MSRFLSPDEVLHALKLADSPYRPPEIIKLKERIEAKTRVGELRMSVSGTPDEELIAEIVQMKLELDHLYAAWVQGTL